MEELIKLLSEYLIRQFDEQLKMQGHVLTGKLNKSIEAKAIKTAQGFDLVFFAENYGGFLNEGVPAERIPYRQGVYSKGGTSLYIQGLIAYVKRRMFLTGKEAVSVAFAIAATHRKEGMPTKNSYKYSSNGLRLKWVDTVVEESTEFIEKSIERFFEDRIEALFVNYFEQNR